MKRVVIGLLGRAGSGKSDAAKYIAQKRNAHRFAFARYIKELARRVWGFVDEQLYGTQEQKETVDPRVGISGREGCIRLGNAVREVLGDAVWINACFNDIKLSSAGIVVIDDVRLPSEAEYIAMNQSFNGFVIKLDYAHRESRADPDALTERCVDDVDPAHIFAVVHHWKDNYQSLHKGLDDVLVRIDQAVR